MKSSIDTGPLATSTRANPATHAYVLAGCLLLAAVAALAIDVPVARFCLRVETTGQVDGYKVPGEVKKLLALSEVFGHGFGVALVCLAWFALDKSRRWSLPRVLACSYGSGFCADVCKLFVGRARPHSFDLSGGVFDSFLGFLPALRAADISQVLQSKFMSLPSGHSATAAGLAVILGSYYPHARWLFALLAALALLQRVETGAHFVSDTLAGAALGCLISGLCLDRRLIGRFFDWPEKLGHARHNSSSAARGSET